MEAIPVDYLKTVFFLCVDEEKNGISKRIPKATGFFVRVQIENSPLRMDYAVTARHCIEEAREYGDIYIRVNRKVGEFKEFTTNIKDWETHHSADVAAIPFFRDNSPEIDPSSELDVIPLKYDEFVGGAPDYKITITRYGKQQEIQPRVGHQVYFIGLFTEHYGQERNLPIARFGNISRMPDYVTINTLGIKSTIVAYLVEFHSWGGHSGSPVFFLYPTVVAHTLPMKSANGRMLDIPIQTDMSWVTSFMGLVSGHYPIEQKAKKSGDILGDIQMQLNSGVAIVTPSIAVTELLMRDDFVEFRKNKTK